MNRRTEALNIRMSVEGKHILNALTKHHGLTQTGLIEMLLRQEVRKEGIPVSSYRDTAGARSDTSSDKEEDHQGSSQAA